MINDIPLICHPAAGITTAVGICVNVRREGSRLQLRYRLTGDVATVRMPPQGTTRRVDGLWRTTCFELFLKNAVASDYYEFNFSPSLAWAAYRFNSYRAGQKCVELQDEPHSTVTNHERFYEHCVAIDMQELSVCGHGQQLHIGLTAVLEFTDGKTTYWALTHSSAQPDFHADSDFYCLDSVNGMTIIRARSNLSEGPWESSV